jgi:hypothetical protein
MTTAMRWRVVVLQVGLIGIVAFCAGFLFWGNAFSQPDLDGADVTTDLLPAV